MPVIRRVLRDGEMGTMQKIYEKIRVACGESGESFYGNCGAARGCIIQHGGSGLELTRGFLNGLTLGCRKEEGR